MNTYHLLHTQEDSLNQEKLLELHKSLREVMKFIHESGSGHVEPKIIFNSLTSQDLRRQDLERAIQLGLDEGLLDFTRDFAISAPGYQSLPAQS